MSNKKTKNKEVKIMKINKKTNLSNPITTKRINAKNVQKFSAILLLSVLAFSVIVPIPVFADENDPIQVINNLSDFIFGIIRAVGIILLAFGIVQVGLSLKSHDPSQRANGFMTLAGGVIITFAKEILNLIAPGMLN